MHKAFKLRIRRDIAPYFGDLGKRQLPCEHYPLHALPVPELHCGGIDGARLRGKVDDRILDVFPQDVDNARVAHYIGIRAYPAQNAGIFRKLAQGALVRHGVHRDIHPFAAGVRIFHPLRQLRRGKVAGACTHSEPVERTVYRIGAVIDGVPELFRVARGG